MWPFFLIKEQYKHPKLFNLSDFSESAIFLFKKIVEKYLLKKCCD